MALGRTAKEIAADMGEELIAVKASKPEGGFVNWCEEHLTFTVRKAQRHMKVAKIKKRRRCRIWFG